MGGTHSTHVENETKDWIEVNCGAVGAMSIEKIGPGQCKRYDMQDKNRGTVSISVQSKTPGGLCP